MYISQVLGPQYSKNSQSIPSIIRNCGFKRCFTTFLLNPRSNFVTLKLGEFPVFMGENKFVPCFLSSDDENLYFSVINVFSEVKMSNDDETAVAGLTNGFAFRNLAALDNSLNQAFGAYPTLLSKYNIAGIEGDYDIVYSFMLTVDKSTDTPCYALRKAGGASNDLIVAPHALLTLKKD